VGLYRASVEDADRFARFLFDDAKEHGVDPIYLAFLRRAAGRMSELMGLPPPNSRGRPRKYLDATCGTKIKTPPPSGRPRVRPVV